MTATLERMLVELEARPEDIAVDRNSPVQGWIDQHVMDTTDDTRKDALSRRIAALSPAKRALLAQQLRGR